jgi:hypothetical protein
MVWGVVVPYSFGDFRPEGECVGWDERLDAYFHKEVTEAGRPYLLGPFLSRPASYRSHVGRKFREELGSTRADMVPLELPLPHEWPEEYRTAKTHEKLGALIEIDGFLAVEERLKALIEEIEPGVHDFRPIRITMPRGKDYPVPYHVLLIGQFRDSFRPELSTEGTWNGKLDYPRVHDTKAGLAGAAMSAKAISGAHLWRERQLVEPKICLSYALQAAIAKAGLRMMKHHKMKSVQ